MKNSSSNVAEQSPAERRMVDVVDRMPNWLIVILTILIALCLLGGIVAFA